MSDGPYVYQLTERLTYFVVSAELVVSGYMLLNAEKLSGFYGAPFLFLACAGAALAGVAWRYLYNQGYHVVAHGLPANDASPRLQLAVYWLFVFLTFGAFVWLIIDGFAYIEATQPVASKPAAVVSGASTAYVVGHQGWVDLATLVVLALSVATAAWAALFSSNEARRNQIRSELNVCPAMTIERNANENQLILGLRMLNVGGGPAIITNVYLTHRGVAFDTTGEVSWVVGFVQHMHNSYNWMGPPLDGVPTDSGGINAGSVVGAGQSQWIVSLQNRALQPVLLQRFQQFVIVSTLVVFYESVHGRRYNTDDPYRPEGNMPAGVTPAAFIAQRYPPPKPPTPQSQPNAP